jgi:hypothetical protein
MAHQLEIVRSDARAIIATFGPVLISIWRADVGVEEVRWTQPAQERLMARYANICSLAIAEPSALRMSHEARHEAARITRSGREACRCIAVVVPLEGFVGAAMRAAVTAVTMIAGTGVRQRTFKSVHAAGEWLLDQLPDIGTRADVAALERAVEKLRADAPAA